MQNQNTLDTLNGLIEISRTFNEIRRVVVVDAGRVETDSEHSYQVALCSWFVAEQLQQQVDIRKVVLSALVHDLPELGKGDLSSISATSEQLAAKALDEQETITVLEQRFTNFPELVEAIKEYEARDSVEAEIVYFVDKILPVLNVWMSKDTYYKDNGITLETWMQKQWGRVEGLNNYELFETLIGTQILDLIRANKDRLFAKSD